jgi:hypothetical protein
MIELTPEGTQKFLGLTKLYGKRNFCLWTLVSHSGDDKKDLKRYYISGGEWGIESQRQKLRLAPEKRPVESAVQGPTDLPPEGSLWRPTRPYDRT